MIITLDSLPKTIIETHRLCPQCAETWDICSCPSWSLNYICFARPQIFWLLHTGFSFDNTGCYSDEKVNRPKSQSAPFEPASCIVAEVKARLARCGEAGEALQDEAPKAERIAASASGLETYIGLSRPARHALNYCSGWRRRSMSYSKWRWQKDEREKRGF